MEGSARSNGYGWATTAEEVVQKENVDLTGKNVFITGGNTGLGKVTVRVLASRGAHIYMACRDKMRGQSAIDDILKGQPNADITLIQLDLSDFASIRKAAAEFLTLDVPLHVLINNAAVAMCPYMETADGLELQMGTNHFGHFLLTLLLLPSLEKAQPSRIVVLSSAGHRQNAIDFDDITGKGTWYTDSILRKLRAYCQSKCANMLFTVELSRRLRDRNLDITVNALHPGVINTELSRHMGADWFSMIFSLGGVLHKSIPQGAATTVYLATAPGIQSESGKYFSDCNVAKPAPHATDPESARRLWTLSEEATGVKW